MRKTKSMLLVEDNDAFIIQVNSAVAQLSDHWVVNICSTGHDAISFVTAEAFNIDLVLLDLGLPDISGIEIIRAIRKIDFETPIVVISVISSDQIVLEAIEAGANGYLLKDNTINQIEHAIRQIQNGIYPLSPSLARAIIKRINNLPPKHQNTDNIKLTLREYETLKLLAMGLSYNNIAQSLKVSLSTVQTYIRAIYRKLNVHSQVQAVVKARQMNLISDKE